jgi:hypothetical protein
MKRHISSTRTWSQNHRVTCIARIVSMSYGHLLFKVETQTCAAKKGNLDILSCCFLILMFSGRFHRGASFELIPETVSLDPPRGTSAPRQI